MTILLYDYHELEEKTGKSLRAWKTFHIILFFCAAVCGILNYVFLFETEHLVDNHCVFYPKDVEFHWVDIPNENITRFLQPGNEDANKIDEETIGDERNNTSVIYVTDAQTTAVPENETETEKAKVSKRETPQENVTSVIETTVEEKNTTIISENMTSRLVLMTSRTLFPPETDVGCQFAEYMPLLSATFSIVWMTLFVICPSGGRSRHGITEPWTIVPPALVFSLVMVVLTGYSFTSTNHGLTAFCAAFQNKTNSTTCSAAEPYLERSYDTPAWWGLAARVAATRAAAAGVWAAWACAATLLLSRCLTHQDFVLKRTAVHVVHDPHEKVIPHLKKQMGSRKSRSRSNTSPSKRDNDVSVMSDPTSMTELATATVEHEDSQPTSQVTTPLKKDLGHKDHFDEELEMTHNPKHLRTTFESPDLDSSLET